MRDAFADLVLGSVCLGCARPGRAVCPACAAGLPASSREAFAAHPDPRPPGLATVIAAAPYAGLVRALVVHHKEERALGLVRPLADLLAISVCALLEHQAPVRMPLLVPVPSRPAVVRSRGHDPLRRIVGRTARLTGAPPPPTLLRQVRRADDQGALDAAGRAANLAGALAVRPARLRRLRGRLPARELAAIVCDDVVTTGATAREAQRALEAAGVPVIGIATVAATRLRRHDRAG